MDSISQIVYIGLIGIAILILVDTLLYLVSRFYLRDKIHEAKMKELKHREFSLELKSQSFEELNKQYNKLKSRVDTIENERYFLCNTLTQYYDLGKDLTRSEIPLSEIKYKMEMLGSKYREHFNIRKISFAELLMEIEEDNPGYIEKHFKHITIDEVNNTISALIKD